MLNKFGYSKTRHWMKSKTLEMYLTFHWFQYLYHIWMRKKEMFCTPVCVCVCFECCVSNFKRTMRCTTNKSTYKISIENSSACCLTDEWNCFENWCVQEQLSFTTVTHKNTVQFKFAMPNDLESSWKIAKSWKSQRHIFCRKVARNVRGSILW